MPTHEQFDTLRKKVETELSDLTTFTHCPKPANEMFAVKLKIGASLIVIRCDQVNSIMISGAEKFPANVFEVSPEPVPGKTWHHVKLAKRGFLDANGKYEFIEGRAIIRDSVSKGGGKYHCETHDFTFPNCERTFAVIKLLATVA